MMVHIHDIKIYVISICSGCEKAQDNCKELISISIPDILEAGHPLCKHCGSELEIFDKCEVENY